jgi:hypothetical protein
VGRLKHARNIAIVFAIGAGVYLIPGGGRAADTFEAALWVAFAIGIAYLVVRMYREHRISIHSLGDRHRALLYGAIALALFAWAARTRMWETGLGELGWFVLVLFVLWALMEVYRYSRTY